MKVTIDLPNHLLRLLDSVKKRESKTRAAIIQEALDQHLSECFSEEDRAFGLWKSNPVDGLAYQKKMRAEWCCHEFSC